VRERNLKSEASALEHKRLADDRKSKTMPLDSSNVAEKVIDVEKDPLWKHQGFIFLVCFIASHLI
jgi:hypothetical protein